ncbi:MAG: hypothetical protein Q7U54_21140 [Bacteroidales bacterium]|nr:hypothetical protein [Bacteroidales bacterium]
MKSKNSNIQLFVMLISLIALTLNSCKKESDTNLTVQEIQKSVPTPEKMRSLHHYSTVYYCGDPAENCLPEVIITPPQKSSSNSLKYAYSDFSEKFKNKDIAEFFTNGDYLTLFPEIKQLPDALSGLRNSNIILHHVVGEKDGLDYYIGLPKNINFSSDWKGLEKCVFVINDK